MFREISFLLLTEVSQLIRHSLSGSLRGHREGASGSYPSALFCPAQKDRRSSPPYIRCVEEDHRARFITPFVGKQVRICEAFGIDIPDRCAPGYTSRKAHEKKRGRPPKKTVDLDS
ncbi:MAG: hypothetical protein LKE40_01135 [Spirochaetia bacterium]|jgi:hypothetical protein|nr:hypothetical protein [Spirochaetia bacterium]